MSKKLHGNIAGAWAVDPDDIPEDENTLLDEHKKAKRQREKLKIKGWDAFVQLPSEVDSSSLANQKWLKVMQIIKLFAYVVLFILILGCGVIAKGAILFMTSQLRTNKTVLYCNRQLHRERTFVTTIPEEERIAWIWCIIFAFAVPEVGTLIQSIRICTFKSWEKTRLKHFMLVAIMETFHVVGLALMFINVLPDLNVVQGAMLTSCVCFVPGLLGLLSRNTKDDESNRFFFMLVDVVALAAQVTAFVVWPLLDTSNPSLWLIPAALVLVSCGWWENYVSLQSPLIVIRSLAQVKEEIRLSKYFIYIFVSVWKIIIFLFSTILILYLKGNTVTHFFTMFRSAFSEHNISIIEIQTTVGGGTIPDLTDVLPNGLTAIMTTDFATPIWVLLIQIFGAYFAYVFGKFACKILLQGFSYALPINLTTPVLISLLIATCILRNNDPCFFHNIIPDYLFYEPPPLSDLSDFIVEEYAWVWLLWLFSQTWITLHIWTPKCERPEPTKKLFVKPLYDGLLIDQSMALNRSRVDQGDDLETGDVDDEAVFEDDSESTPEKEDLLTKIFVCATMWHESNREMSEFLKSILRLDMHQCAMKNYQDFFEVIDPDFYELETHILFDDAFEESDHDDTEFELNEYVKRFIHLVDKTAFNETRIHVGPPKKYPTPYGGRLIWTLPGNTKMYVHLKDNTMIRHRKRWSQVMYMYYLLGHRIKDMPISNERKKALENNTFILALDGDIDFQPSAVKLLIDLMKADKNLGAACGRIHPVGSGPMVWYQMFEYAVGHWLQKATEHMIGCVLCSPGCFSLFRAKALMDKDVLKVYTTTSSEARHYVQYDQGEDRWLCTLLLKRGYRVEYSAASDSYTHAPEEFTEFYNQRRRWIPSTMANIMDLLTDYKPIVKKNKNISFLYIMYQMLLMVGTILGPGTIFLMLVGAFVAAFQMGIWESFYYNIIPVLIFIVICFICDSKTQLLVAGVISMIYGLVMMAVIVGIFIQMSEDSWLAPSSLFLFVILGQIIIAALMHPQELSCLPCGVVYYVTIPSMYMLLVIYSLAHINDISWGTRDTKPKKTSKESEEKKKQAKETTEKTKQKKANQTAEQNSIFRFGKNDKGSVECSLAGIFKCVLCTLNEPCKEEEHLVAITKSLERLENRLGTLESKPPDSQEKVPGRRPPSFMEPHSAQHSKNPKNDDPADTDQQDSDMETTVSENYEMNQERTLLINPYWLEDKELKKSEVGFLLPREEQFWEELIKEYLSPIEENEEEQKRVAADLQNLRDKCFVTFFMLNAIFVTVIFLMQLNQDLLHIRWPFGVKRNVSYDERSREVHITMEYLQLEPLGLAFVVFFGVILVIQFTAMLFHRFNTFIHILASTSLQDWGYCWKKPANISEKSLLSNDDKGMVEDLHQFPDMDSDHEHSNNNKSGRQKTSLNSGGIKTLDDVFRARIFSVSEGNGRLPGHMSTRRSRRTLQSFVARSKSIVAQRRNSQLKNVNQVNGNFFAEPGPSTNTENSIREDFKSYPGIVNRAFELD